MPVVVTDHSLPRRVLESLHGEALRLSEETRRYLEGEGGATRDALGPRERVRFACEALKATTRLARVIAWLHRRRAASSSPLAACEPSETAVLDELPAPARRLILAGIDLHARAGRLAQGDGARTDRVS